MTYEYCQYENKAYTRRGKFIIAVLDISNSEFTAEEEMTENDAEHYYLQMEKEYKSFQTFIKYCD